MAYLRYEKMNPDHRSRYKLVLSAAQRANEINSGVKPLIQTKSKKATTIALEEFVEGKVKFFNTDEDGVEI